MSRRVAGVALVIGAMALAACSPSSPTAQSSQSEQSAPSPQSGGAGAPSPAPSEAQSPAEPLPPFNAPSDGCAAMDGVLAEALDAMDEGRAFISARDSGDSASSVTAWSSFVIAFASEYRNDMASAAMDDTATEALDALDSYTAALTLLSDPTVSEFADPAQAEANIKMGREPQRDPEYAAAVDAVNSSHITLSQCLPHWPILF